MFGTRINLDLSAQHHEWIQFDIITDDGVLYLFALDGVNLRGYAPNFDEMV